MTQSTDDKFANLGVGGSLSNIGVTIPSNNQSPPTFGKNPVLAKSGCYGVNSL
jgi:hypothetical protein